MKPCQAHRNTLARFLSLISFSILASQYVSPAAAHCDDARDVCECAKICLGSTLTNCSKQIKDGSHPGGGEQVWSGIKCCVDSPVFSCNWNKSKGCTNDDYVAVGAAAMSGNCNQLPP